MSSIVDVKQPLRSLAQHSTAWNKTGPSELASVIGKLELLERDLVTLRARVGSDVLLLDMNTQDLIELRLGERSCSADAQVSIFSPLGARLLAARPGDILNLGGFSGGYRLLLVRVSAPAN